MPDHTIFRAVRRLVWHSVHLYRKKLKRTVFIGITGSSGKTTAKELIYAILSSAYSGTRSKFTFNGLSSHCRTVMKTMPWHRFCVLEVGAGLPDSVLKAVTMIPPDMGVVLNIGLEHFTAMRSREATAASKELMVTSLSKDGVAFINTDDPMVEAMTSNVGARIVRFGCGERADIRASHISSSWPDRLSFTVTVNGEDHAVKTGLYGKHWVSGIAAAIAVGVEMKVPIQNILEVIERFAPIRGRMCPVEMPDGVTYIRDDWKAVYWSMQLAFDFMKEARAKRRIIIIGTISDYPGAASPKYRNVAAQALDSAELVIFTGPNAPYAVKGGKASSDPRLLIYPMLEEVDLYLRENLQPGDLVLIKGSGKVDKLEHLIAQHQKRLAAK